MKKIHVYDRYEPMSRSLCASYYILFPSFNLIKNYITSTFLMWFHQSLMFELISSVFVPDVCGLMRHILYLIFIAPHCNVTVPLVQYCVIKNISLYSVSYFYAAWLSSMDLYPTLYVWSTLLLFSRILSLLICAWFSWRVISNPHYLLSGEYYHIQILIGLDYKVKPIWCWANWKFCFCWNSRPWVFFVKISFFGVQSIH